MATRLFDEVLVVTDSPIIFKEITHYGGYALMSKLPHESGSDRIAEAVADLEVDIVLNVQGDEPFVKKDPLQKLLNAFEGSPGRNVQVASLMQALNDIEQVGNPNTVKVVVDKNSDALLFSRSPIPYHRDKGIAPVYYQHIGVYAFRKQALMNFSQTKMSPLEEIEKIECLRYLENGIKIRMVETEYEGVSIDTPEDLERAKSLV
jgi:3-deoxy-D-manno-octulosonate cytidylyltransferase